MSNKKKLTRGINKEFAEIFKKTELYKLCKDPKNELFIGIRNNYINVYYRSKNVAKVSDEVELKYEIHEKYLNDGADGQKNVSDNNDTFIVKNIDKIVERIEKTYSTKPEKVAQQRLILNNNANGNAKYFCIDMEYVKARLNSEEEAYGRFDIIAISKEKPYTVALIELKYGKGAMGGKSGVLKHSRDFVGFISNDEYKKHLLNELIDIINSYKLLDIDIPFEQVSEKDFADNPNFYFITLNNNEDDKEDRARKSMQRYFLNSVSRCSSKNVEKELNINVTQQNDKNFTPYFLFSDDEGDNIKDIIDDNLYNKRNLI